MIQIMTMLLLLLCTGVNAQPSPALLRDSLQHYAPTDSIKFLRYRALFLYYRRTPPNDSAIWYAEKGIEAFKHSRYERGQAALLFLEGGLYSDRRMFDSATAKYTGALKLYIALKNIPRVARVYNMLGVVEGNKGNYDAAFNYSITARKIAEAARDTEAIAIADMNLAATYDKTGNQEMAMKYILKALVFANYIETWNRILLNTNLGSMYFGKKDYVNAVIYLNNALVLCRNPKYVSYSVEPHLTLGDVFSATKQEQKALYYYREALEVSKKFSFPESQSKALRAIAAIKMKTNPQEALSLNRQALNIARQAGLKEETAAALMGMAEASRQTGDYKQALALTEERQQLRDSMFNLEKAKTIAALQSAYDLAKASEAARRLELAKEQEAQKKMVTILVAAVLSVLLSIVLIFWRKSEVLSQKLNKTAREQEQSEGDLRISNSFKEQYYALLSSDLRSPMLYLKSTLKDLQADPAAYSGATIRHHLDSFYSSADNMYQLAENFMSWIRAIDPAFRPMPEATDIDALLQEIEEQYNLPAAEPPLINVVTVPGLTYETDKALLLTIVRNVADNAIRHGLADNIVITAKKEKEHLLLCIENNGSPIPEELLQKLNAAPFAATQPITNAHRSFGYLIIAALTHKLNGTYKIMNTAQGPKVSFVFGSIAQELL